MIHRSEINNFIVKKLSAGVSANELTLRDILEDDEFRHLFENSFVVVSENTTLAEAKEAMQSRDRCLDIFITATGKKDEAVVGWLSDKDIA